MRKAVKWWGLLAVTAVLLVSLLAGVATAVADDVQAPPPETQNAEPAGVPGEGGGFGLAGGNATVLVDGSNDEVPADTIAAGGSDTTPASVTATPDADTKFGYLETLIWNDSRSPNGVFDEADKPIVLMDGLTVELWIKNPPNEDGSEGDWVFVDAKESGPEPAGFARLLPSIFPPWGGGWVGWDHLETNYTGPGYADYKLVLKPPAGCIPTNGTERTARIYACALFSGVYFYPESLDPAYRSYSVVKLTGSISGYKWHDYNADGVRQPNEPFLKDWTIALTLNGKVIKTAKTAADGSFKFEGLEPGTYQVWEMDKCGWNQVHPLYRPCVRTPGWGYAKGNYKVVVERGFDYKGCNFGNLRMNNCSAWFYYNLFLLLRLYPSWL